GKAETDPLMRASNEVNEKEAAERVAARDFIDRLNRNDPDGLREESGACRVPPLKDEVKVGPVEDKAEHGNTAGSQPAEVYAKYDKNGNFLKWGVSNNPDTRYDKAEIGSGSVERIAQGPRNQMLKLERWFT